MVKFKTVFGVALVTLTTFGGLSGKASVLAATFSTTLEQPLVKPTDRFQLTGLPQYQRQIDEKLLGVELEFAATLTGHISIPTAAQRQIILATFIHSLTLIGPNGENLFLALPATAETLRLPARTTDDEVADFWITTPLSGNNSGVRRLTLAADDPIVTSALVGPGNLNLSLIVTDQTSLIGTTQPTQMSRQIQSTVQVTYQTMALSEGNPDDIFPKETPVTVPEPSFLLALTVWLTYPFASGLGRRIGLTGDNPQFKVR